MRHSLFLHAAQQSGSYRRTGAAQSRQHSASLCQTDEDGILVGEIINVSADESVVTDGKVDLSKLRPIAFDPFNNAYMGLGEKVGSAFSDGKKIK